MQKKTPSASVRCCRDNCLGVHSSKDLIEQTLDIFYYTMMERKCQVESTDLSNNDASLSFDRYVILQEILLLGIE